VVSYGDRAIPILRKKLEDERFLRPWIPLGGPRISFIGACLVAFGEKGTEQLWQVFNETNNPGIKAHAAYALIHSCNREYFRASVRHLCRIGNEDAGKYEGREDYEFSAARLIDHDKECYRKFVKLVRDWLAQSPQEQELLSISYNECPEFYTFADLLEQ
jgi:hypothetical protein